MIVSPEHRKLILRLRDPQRITAIIPKSRIFTHQGKEFVAVHHGVEETKVLRNIGIAAPSPMKYYYGWPGQFEPFEHQVDTAAFMSLENRMFNLNGMGTGKTLATLWSFDYLRGLGLARRALVVTPLTTLDRTWADEIFRHFPHLDVVVLYGSRKVRLDLLKTDADIYLINHDGIKINGFVEAMHNRPDIDTIIIDEIAQVARNSGTDRFRALNQIVNKQSPRRAWGLTGTPTPNKPTDAWAQCRLLVPAKVPPYFNRFRDMVERQINQFLWVPRENAVDVVHEAMQPSIRYSLDECIDMPECIYQTRSAALSPEQLKAYRNMLTKLRIEAAEGSVTAANEAVKAQKLIQVACGSVYGNSGVEVELDTTPRLAALTEIIEEAGAKVIVFVPFVSALRKVSLHLQAQFGPDEVGEIYGEIGQGQRNATLRAFQEDAKPRIIVAQPSTMSHGLNLTAASTIVWFAPITSNDTFQQANARISRPGQKNVQLIVMIEGTEIERRYYARLKEKQRVQGVFLDMVQEEREII